MAWYAALSHTRCIEIPTGFDGNKGMDRVGQPQRGSLTWSYFIQYKPSCSCSRCINEALFSYCRTTEYIYIPPFPKQQPANPRQKRKKKITAAQHLDNKSRILLSHSTRSHSARSSRRALRKKEKQRRRSRWSHTTITQSSIFNSPNHHPPSPNNNSNSLTTELY